MKQSDVQLGGTYYTYIGNNLCPVVVTAIVAAQDGRRTSFRVTRVGSLNPLPQLRVAAALRKEPVKFF